MNYKIDDKLTIRVRKINRWTRFLNWAFGIDYPLVDQKFTVNYIEKDEPKIKTINL